MTFIGPSLPFGVVLLDLGQIGSYDSLLGDRNQEGKQIQPKPCGSSAFKDPWECVSSWCIKVFECFEDGLDERADDSSDKKRN